MKTYKTFLRSSRNFEEFATAEKIEQDTNLSSQEAIDQCRSFNENRDEEKIAAGTKMEFEKED